MKHLYCILFFSFLVLQVIAKAGNSPISDVRVFIDKYAEKSGFNSTHVEGSAINSFSQNNAISNPATIELVKKAESIDVLSYNQINNNLRGTDVFGELIKSLSRSKYTPILQREQNGESVCVMFQDLEDDKQELVIINATDGEFRCIRMEGGFNIKNRPSQESSPSQQNTTPIIKVAY